MWASESPQALRGVQIRAASAPACSGTQHGRASPLVFEVLTQPAAGGSEKRGAASSARDSR
eukprot:6177723-Pleurochrysis_carterae.AAC.4